MARFEVLDPPIRYTTRQEFLGEIRARIAAKKPGEWLVTEPQGNTQELQSGQITRQDLDKIAPDNPVFIHWLVTVDGLVNSKALAPLLERYPKISGVYRDAKGEPTGRLSGLANPTMLYEFIPQVAPDQLAPYYKMEMEEIAAQGMTTVSTRLSPNHLAVYSLLHAENDMPVRMAYTLEILSRSEDTESLATRIVGLQGGSGSKMWGTGDSMLWAVGVTPDSLDATIGPGAACVRKEYPREAPNFPQWRFQNYGPHGICRLQDPN
jgi:predicted amidohydrolase YtcJ